MDTQSTADLLYGYNANGWLTHRFTRTGTGTSTNGYFTTYGYDAVGNLTHVTYPAGTASLTNGFDALNRLTNRLDGLGPTRYTYAVLGNGVHTVTEDGPWAADEVTVTNRLGRRAGLRIAQPAGAFVVTNAWDAAGRWAVVGGTAGTFTYGYGAGSAGRLPVSLTLPGGGFITNTYDVLARLTRTELRSPGGSQLNAHGYQYDAASQRTLVGRTNSAAGSWNGYVLAAYDPAGQLTHAWSYRPDGTPVSSERWSYGYDAAQNLAKRTNNTAVETFTVNALNQLVTLPDGAVQYDRRGNLGLRTFSGSQGYWTWSYDHENRLTSVATDTSYTPEYYRWKVEFAYDGAGRLRVRRDYTWSYGQWSLSGEWRYLYDGWLLVQARSGANTPLVSYTRGRDLSGGLEGAGGIGGLLARSHGYSGGNWSSHNFYHADGNGNVTALVNSSGTLQAGYKYDPYGRLRSQTGPLSSANRLRWSSKPWEAYGSSGLYSYGYRFYDPYTQRWLNRDLIGEKGSFNLYAFVNNTPINRFDPFGLYGFVDPFNLYGFGLGLEISGALIVSCQAAIDKTCNSAVGANVLLQLRVNGIDGNDDAGGGNAFRHCLAACQSVKACGIDSAKRFWNGREDGGTAAGRQDLANNEVGFGNASQSSCWDACIDSWKKGKLTCGNGPCPPPPSRAPIRPGPGRPPTWPSY